MTAATASPSVPGVDVTAVGSNVSAPVGTASPAATASPVGDTPALARKEANRKLSDVDDGGGGEAGAAFLSDLFLRAGGDSVFFESAFCSAGLASSCDDLACRLLPDA